MDREVQVSDLLRKALLLAKKLGIDEFAAWAEAELDGYFGLEEAEVPAYRFSHGQPKMQDRFGRWGPIHFPDDELEEMFTRRPNGQPISQLEGMLEGRKDQRNLMMPYQADVQSRLWEAVGEQGQAGLFVQYSDIQGILDAVRTAVLKWTIRLEEEGVIGDGLTFTEEEKEKAGQTPQNVNYFFAPSAVQQGSHSVMAINSIAPEDLRAFLSEVKDLLPKVGLEGGDAASAQADVASLEQQLTSPSPNQSAIKALIKSIGSLVRRGSEKAIGLAVERLVEKTIKGEL